MSRRYGQQSADGIVEYIAGRGITLQQYPGAPTAGVPFAVGGIYQDLTNAVAYINTGTASSATWLALRTTGGINTAVINTADTTVGAATLTAAAVVGGIITRSGSVAAYTDTTPTATLLAAALPTGTAVGSSFILRIINTVPYVETLSAGTGVTLSGITLIPPLSTNVYLVTYASATTFTMYGLDSVPLVNLPPSQYTTGALQSATFPAGALTGAGTVHYNNTGTTPAALTVRTAAQMFADIPNCQVGFSYTLFIRNSSGSANTATITADGGATVTLTGTMTIAQNVTRMFNVVFPTNATCTIQSMGIFAAGA